MQNKKQNLGAFTLCRVTLCRVTLALLLAGVSQTILADEETAADDGIAQTIETSEISETSETGAFDMPSGTAPVVVVTSSRHSKDDALINDFISLEEVATAPGSVTELLADQPGLTVNGQPGLFQTLSIRGLARQRVHAYINGMRITSERRAGVAASFVDPLLLSGAEVTQGPASTYYGSGAIAGSIHLMTRQEDSPWFHVGFNSDGNEWVTAAGTGNERYAASIAYRERNNGETVTGDPKNNHFSQHSLFYIRHFEFGDYNLDWQLIESSGDDIGKDNSRFPDSRITSYPEEKHLLTQLTLTTNADWVARLYFHDQSLITQDIRPANRINRVNTDSLDIGFAFENQWQQGDFKGLYGFDYFGRRGVKSFETETSLQTQLSTGFSALDDGEENEAAVFATVNRDFESWSIHGGLRANYQSQKSAVSNSISDDYTTYFLTAKKPLGQFDLSFSYGTGFRFASLSERLFTGTTGRGQTIGNANLKPEESKAYDLGITYSEDAYRVDFHRFFTDVENFIERVSVDDDTRTYRNVTNGEIDGWQYQVAFFPSSQLTVELSGQEISGEDNLGNPLADIPAKRHQISFMYEQENWSGQMTYGRRSKKTEVGGGEIPLESANIASLKFNYKFSNDWTMQVGIENLADEKYFNSADDLGTLATGREFSISVYSN
ncbi:TonB-dependent receptor [Aliikangiella coralliicola]|uniref:TonB-dependent receptor n=1 Tax=Aliikangiella coralliicola TaxID=2592383 RepID=A0A545UEP6_9GAMM|nr:TonB-dependent receptor [Aliikangiella coralliicola]TQV87946.1 TonB-dependent receptor [Aliikangiella coralliicola]